MILDIIVLAYETDFGGVVSNTRYPEYLERGRYALMHRAGFTVSEIWEKHGVQPVVRRVEIDYLGFARHEDRLQLDVRIEAHSGATTTLDFHLARPLDGATILRARQTLAYLNTKWRPVRVPEIYRAAMPIEEVMNKSTPE